MLRKLQLNAIKLILNTIKSSFAVLSLLVLALAGPILAQQAVYMPPAATKPSDVGLKSVYTVAGLVADGTTDNTSAIQAALTAAGMAGGGKVQLPSGKFSVTALSVPVGVTLAGSLDYTSSSSGLPNGAGGNSGPGSPGGATLPGQFGTWLYVGSAAGSQQANTTSTEDTRTPTITCAEDAGVIGLSMYWPGQNQASTGNPYAFPWAIKLIGNNGFVRDCQLLNPFQGIWCDSARSNVRNVNGQPLFIGIRVDNCGDCCRWEDVHFNPFWSFQTTSNNTNTGVFTWECNNGIAFQCYRSDGHFAHQCFCYGYNIGFQFTSTAAGGAGQGTSGTGASLRVQGATYGNFTACGADLCAICIQLGQTQAPQGVQFAGGLFVATQTNPGGTGVLGTGIKSYTSFTGIASFIGGAIWGQASQIASLNSGTGAEVTIEGMSFDQWTSGNYAIGCGGGMTKVVGCTFRQSTATGQINSAGASTRVIFIGNVCKGGVESAAPLGNSGKGDSGDVFANNTGY